MLYAIWVLQFSIMAAFDTRKSTLNKLLNVSVLGTSLWVTYDKGGVAWLVIPFLLIPLIAGLVGGLVKGLYLKQKSE